MAPGLPAAVFEARMRKNACEGQMQTALIWYNQRGLYIICDFQLSIAERLTRAARGAARTDCSDFSLSKPRGYAGGAGVPPVPVVLNFRVGNRKVIYLFSSQAALHRARRRSRRRQYRLPSSHIRHRRSDRGSQTDLHSKHSSHLPNNQQRPLHSRR